MCVYKKKEFRDDSGSVAPRIRSEAISQITVQEVQSTSYFGCCAIRQFTCRRESRDGKVGKKLTFAPDKNHKAGFHSRHKDAGARNNTRGQLIHKSSTTAYVIYLVTLTRVGGKTWFVTQKTRSCPFLHCSLAESTFAVMVLSLWVHSFNTFEVGMYRQTQKQSWIITS